MGTFEQLRPQLRSGDLVRRATMSDYCHCGVVLVKDDRIFILEARYRIGVTMRLLELALPCDWIATGCDWTPTVELSALMKLQTRYSIFAALAHGLGLRPPAQTNDCSIFAAHAVAPGLGFEVVERGMTPGHLAAIFMDAGCEKKALN